MANEVLGRRRTPCPDCGKCAEVMQAKRKGAHLYTRCVCGLEQKTGAEFQLKVWQDTDWSGEPPTPPSNIEGKIGQATDQPKAGAALADFDPTEPEAEKATEKKPKKQAKGRGGVLGLVLLLSAMGGAAWAATKNS